MKFFDQLRLIERVDGLIRRKQTGSPQELAEKLGVSRATVCRYIAEMKERGIPICYSSQRETYYYNAEVNLRFDFHAIDRNIAKNAKGGQKFSFTDLIF